MVLDAEQSVPKLLLVLPNSKALSTALALRWILTSKGGLSRDLLSGYPLTYHSLLQSRRLSLILLHASSNSTRFTMMLLQ